MNKTIKTFQDGSELTTNMALVAAVGGIALSIVTTGIVWRVSEIQSARAAKKAGIKPNKM